jgi:hypothetical protein
MHGVTLIDSKASVFRSDGTDAMREQMTNNVLRQWNKYHADQLELALDGDDGNIVRRIMAIVRDLTPQKMPALLHLMDEADWRLVDANTKFTLLHELNSAIISLRESQGQTGF